ncbi:hypothetical protein D3C72_1611100 [compost metagenome]
MERSDNFSSSFINEKVAAFEFMILTSLSRECTPFLDVLSCPRVISSCPHKKFSVQRRFISGGCIGFNQPIIRPYNGKEEIQEFRMIKQFRAAKSHLFELRRECFVRELVQFFALFLQMRRYPAREDGCGGTMKSHFADVQAQFIHEQCSHAVTEQRVRVFACLPLKLNEYIFSGFLDTVIEREIRFRPTTV